MKTTFFPFLLCWVFLAGCESPTGNDSFSGPTSIDIQYPVAYRDSMLIDTFFGKSVPDPYRWMEDPQGESLHKWIDSQQKLTDEYLSTLPSRENLRKRLQEVWQYQQYGLPETSREYLYFTKTDGQQAQPVLFRQVVGSQAKEEVVLDPNFFSEDGTTALGDYAFSQDGRYLAYERSEGGSDWRTIRILNIDEGKHLSDTLNWVKFSNIAWSGNGFFYSRYPAPLEGEVLSGRNEFHQVFYHDLGTPQSSDQLVFADRSRPFRGFSTQTTEDERYLILSVWETTENNALYLADLATNGFNFIPLVENIQADYEVIGNMGDEIYILTNEQADNGKLVKVSMKKPESAFWETVLPESDAVLQEAKILGGKLVVHFLQDARSELVVFNLEGEREGSLNLPGLGTVSGFSGSLEDPIAFYRYESFTTPPIIVQVDLQTLTHSIFKRSSINFHSDNFITEQVWYKSYDGTEVPMFLTHKKGLKMDGKRPVLLYGYGGFNIPVLPRFSPAQAALLEHDGIFAVANIRGGGEFGKRWHQAGMRSNKQNVFDDFQAAAEFLIREGYTSSEKLGIEGRSNGGLLVGACLTQRPDLYQVAFPIVGVLDMLRYQHFTIGAAWASDYGLSDNPQDFDHLIAYSPLHNVEPMQYPATMILTADHDDRVFPAHSYKFAAELQYQQRGPSPILLRVDTKAGHGAGKSLQQQIQESADKAAFFFYQVKEPVQYDYSK
jgi:prolyl oligopeptidase